MLGVHEKTTNDGHGTCKLRPFEWVSGTSEASSETKNRLHEDCVCYVGITFGIQCPRRIKKNEGPRFAFFHGARWPGFHVCRGLDNFKSPPLEARKA